MQKKPPIFLDILVKKVVLEQLDPPEPIDFKFKVQTYQNSPWFAGDEGSANISEHSALSSVPQTIEYCMKWLSV
jgi:hypothetical protein